MMNPMLRLVSAFALCFSVVTGATAKETITVTVVDDKKQPIALEVPYMPTRIAALNFTTVDILDQLGLGDRIVGMTKSSAVPAHLKKYADNPNIVNLGSMKEIDMEALMSLQPDVIFSSDRTVRQYKLFSMIAPTVASFVEYQNGFFQGFAANAKLHGEIFGQQAHVQAQLDGFTARINAMKSKAQSQSAMLGLFTGGSLKVLGDKGRMSLITNDIGFNNLADGVNVNHGNNASYELFVKLNPDYVFILDKDVAVGRNSNSAKELLDNELFKQTRAHQTQRMVFLEPGDTWYVADGGFKALDMMLGNIEAVMN
ncbi:ABC transporter substrate-binding protein [Vibrio sp. SM6]|uniref:ABC transporter substrate-binding protein n=1 Tax=Vibrio agarilyticus TaxID=2726741 RepID=A0A7X8YHC3_9VIBR|nr:ABC transporter substrate-binding protein [Vibrio agarilyticus]NLS13207.1 ABC transporter substrate-binding protein [Vibrio agarilyticus]